MMSFKKRKIHTLIELAITENGFKVLRDESYWHDGAVSLAGGTPTLEAADWAFYEDGTESGSVIIGTKNNNQTLNTDTIYFFRQGLEETAGNKAANQTMQLQYNHNGGGFTNVTGSSSVIQSVASANITDQNDTTQRITAFTYDPSNKGIDEVDGIAGGSTADIDTNGYEGLFSFQIISGDVSGSDTIVLKIVNPLAADADFDVYQQTNPTITVAAGATTTPKSAAMTAIGVVGLAKKITYLKSIPITASGTVGLAKNNTYVKSLAITALGVVGFSQASVIGKLINIVATGVVGFSQANVLGKTFNIVATAVPSLATVATFPRSAAMTAVGVVGLVKKMFVTANITAVAVPNLVRKFFYTGTIVAVGVVGFTQGLLFSVSGNMTALAVVGLSTVFIAASAILKLSNILKPVLYNILKRVFRRG